MTIDQDYVVRAAPVRVVERWFAGPDGSDADVLICRQVPAPIAGARCTPFATRVIDLEQDLDDIHAGIHKSTRYEIRRAPKDGTVIRFIEEPGDELGRFFDDHDTYFVARDRPPINRKQVEAMVASGLLELSVAIGGPDDCPLVWNTHVVTPTRARGLHSVSRRGGESSDERRVVSRANRLLEWETIVRHHTAGRQDYDLGGWYAGTDDARKLAINEFKVGFGGTVIVEYNCRVARTPRGRAWELATRFRRGTGP